MTVVHLLPAMEQGGVETVVCDLNRAVTAAGWKSVVISAGGRLVPRIEADGGRHFTLDVKSKNPLTCLTRALRLRKLIGTIASESNGEVIVAAHSRVPAWLFAWANRRLRLPWITYAHGANSVSRYSAIMTKGDLVIAPSEFLARFLLDNYPDPSLQSRLRIVNPPVDLARFDPDAVDSGFAADKRREWGVGESAFCLMSVGRVSPVKGFDNVIRDFAENAARKRADSRLVIVGGADARHQNHLAELKALAASLGVADRVVFAGAQSKMPECISIADEIVCGNTKKPESFGLCVCEALAMNKPVRLLREFGGAAEIISSVRSHGGKNTRDAVRALYGFDAVARKTIAEYEGVLKRARGT